jgi:5-methylcytosine-specific restriction protein A
MAWQGRSPNRTRGRTWARIRKQVLAEEPYCRRCRTNPSTICDHVTPLTMGGTDERSNLAGLCGTCHNEKTAAESAIAQGKRPPKPRAQISVDGWPVEP